MTEIISICLDWDLYFIKIGEEKVKREASWVSKNKIEGHKQNKQNPTICIVNGHTKETKLM